MGNQKYPEIYKKLFYKGDSQKEEDIQKAWEAVDESWKEIILNLNRTNEALYKTEKNIDEIDKDC